MCSRLCGESLGGLSYVEKTTAGSLSAGFLGVLSHSKPGSLE
jgi:hypothetical protein